MESLRGSQTRMGRGEVAQNGCSTRSKIGQGAAGVLVKRRGLWSLDNCLEGALSALENLGKCIEFGKRMGR